MRKEFFETLSRIAKQDPRVWLLTADMLCPGSDEFPKERFINCGVAEQNLIGIAAGLALEGAIPFCYSISTFLIFRAYEFIRNDIAHQNLPVRLVGCYGPYPDYGISHNCGNNEDINCISSLPNFKICNEKKIKQTLIQSYYKPYPIYFRLPRG